LKHWFVCSLDTARLDVGCPLLETFYRGRFNCLTIKCKNKDCNTCMEMHIFPAGTQRCIVQFYWPLKCILIILSVHTTLILEKCWVVFVICTDN